MRRFKQHIHEALDKPYPVDADYRHNGAYFRFNTDDGRKGWIEISIDYFYGEYAAEVSFEIDGSTAKTGGGDQFRIFATVGHALQEFFKRYKDKIDKIHFTADKPFATAGSRVSLYKKFAKKMAKQFNMKLDTFDAGNVMEFDLIKEERLDEKRTKLMYIYSKDWRGKTVATDQTPKLIDGLENPSSAKEIISFAQKNDDHCRIYITPDNRVICWGGSSLLADMVIHGEVAAGEGFDWRDKKAVRGLFSLSGDKEPIWMVMLQNFDKNKSRLARLSKGFKELMGDPEVWTGEYEDMW